MIKKTKQLKDFKENTETSLQVSQSKDITERKGIKNSSILVSDNIEKDYLRFSIIDTGPGVSENFINTVNREKTVTLVKKDNTEVNKKFMGTGYGISIVQRLCRVLKSKLSVKANTPKGSVFFFDVPQDKLVLKEIINGFDNGYVQNDNDLIIMKKVSENKEENNIHSIKSVSSIGIDDFKYFHPKDKLIFDSYNNSFYDKFKLNISNDDKICNRKGLSS